MPDAARSLDALAQTPAAARNAAPAPDFEDLLTGDPQHLLQAMLSRNVIPNLVERARRDAPVPDDTERDMLLRLVLRGDHDGASALLRQCVAAGMEATTICEGLIGPVANCLGNAWEEDSCDFVAVTFGVTLLGDLLGELRELDPPRPPRRKRGGFPPSMLLAAMPGEQHTLGLRIVADSFERAGWDVSIADAQSAGALMAQTAAQAHDVIGISVATDRLLGGIGPLVSALRRLSRNPKVRLIVGGPAVLRHPDAGTRIGADAVAIDAQSAVATATASLGSPAS
ncbi:MAG: cobalamin B12-binding domain-containing protein [Pseudomonadota bacterium]